MMSLMKIDWSQSPDVECKPDVMSGVPVVVGTRIPVEAVLVNAADFTAEQIVAEIYPSLPVDRARRIISFAKLHAPVAG